MVVERSNSFNSNIDWIVHGIEGSSPHAAFVFDRRFVFGHVYSVDREASFRFDCACAWEVRIVVNGLRVNRLVFAHAREASINIPTDTDIHTDRPLTHTHTHTNIQTLHSTDTRSYSNMPLFRGRLLRSTWEDIIYITLHLLRSKAVFNSIVLTLYNIVILWFVQVCNMIYDMKSPR